MLNVIVELAQLAKMLYNDCANLKLKEVRKGGGLMRNIILQGNDNLTAERARNSGVSKYKFYQFLKEKSLIYWNNIKKD